MDHDIFAFLTSCLLLLGYYLYLARRSRRVPGSSVHVVNAQVREQWIAMVMRKNNMEILAVQTLRNSVMAANFMASTSILLIIGTLNISEKIGQWSLQWYFYGPSNDFSSELWKIKLGLLLLDFSIAFFCFSMAIRFYNHVGYMVNLGCEDAGLDLCKQACAYLNRAGSYYTFGTRTFFLSLPIILWFIGPYFLILATVVLIAGLAKLDKMPN